MKKVTLSALILILLLTGCGSSNNGELTGVQGRKKFFEPEPFEMAFIPAGNFMMGPSDQDAVWAMNSISKCIMYAIQSSGRNLVMLIYQTDSILWSIRTVMQ
jgi:hypothetical protein